MEAREIVSGTIAKDVAGRALADGGGSVANLNRQVSITNSTIMEKQAFDHNGGGN